MASSASTQTSGVRYRHLARLALLAAVAAAITNAVLFYIFRPLGAWPQDILVAGNNPMTVVPIILFSCVGVLGAAVALGLLARFTEHSERNFYIVAALVFIGFFFTPFTIPNAPTIMVIALEIVHVPPALASIIVLPKALEGNA